MTSKDLESAQNALGGGGRYDSLLSEFGGPDMPAIGFAIGLDRTIMLMKELGIEYTQKDKTVKAYMVSILEPDEPYCLAVLKVIKGCRDRLRSGLYQKQYRGRDQKSREKGIRSGSNNR